MTLRVPIPAQVPAGVTAEADGIPLGAGPVTVDAYIDFLCPFCRMFEQASGERLDTMVADELITLIYHPLGFLDRLSTTRYSTRAAAASGCASDVGRFRPYSRVLFANQPPEGGPGRSDGELVDLAASVGVPREEFALCVAEQRYVDWVEYVTQEGLARGVSGTPSVYVQGVPVPANPRTIIEAVRAAA